MRKRLYLNFPPNVIKEPILSQTIPQKFNVKTNLRGASISDEIAIVYVDVEGEEANVNNTVEYLKGRGVNIKEVDPNAPISKPPEF
jgi:ABC-type methionine transport system ATPase subunit